VLPSRSMESKHLSCEIKIKIKIKIKKHILIFRGGGKKRDGV
jgi:hypothetical protein